jgi:hypothetical protein
MLKLLLPLLFLTACAGAPVDTPHGEIDAYFVELPEENIMLEGEAPTPFSAQEIRNAMTESTGRYYRLHGDPQYSMMQFIFSNITDETCSIETMYYDLEGFTDVVEDQDGVEWGDLQAHAAFRAETVTVCEGTAYTEAGRFDCWVYKYEEDLTHLSSDGEPMIARVDYYFAKDLPGPPVYMVEFSPTGEIEWELELYDHYRP